MNQFLRDWNLQGVCAVVILLLTDCMVSTQSSLLFAQSSAPRRIPKEVTTTAPKPDMLKSDGMDGRKDAPTLPRIQDDFAELDDTLQATPGNAQVNDRFIMTTLETARQQYLRALSYINRSDTARAARSFDQSIETLNKVSDFPKIQENQDFMDLMQSIIEDYENYIRNLDNMSENSSIVVLRDKFFQSVENADMPSYDDLNFPRGKDSTKRQFVPLNLPESSSALATMTGMRGVNLQIPMPENQEVLWAVEFLAVRGRRYFQKWMERTGKWFPMMRKIAREEGAPEEILYLSIIESGLSPYATSWAKAVGLWQFIKGTGQMYGLGVDYWMDERRDPEKATRAAMRHLKDLYNELGDWHLALAAYNCGLGGVRRAVARSGMTRPNYWDVRPYLPKETRNYVPLYVAAAKVCMNPEAYGFTTLQFEDRFSYETVPVSEAVDFRVLARCAGVGEETLHDLNPELIHNSTPPYAEQYPLKIPIGTKSTFVANYEKAGQSDKHSWTMHEISGSETLASIAKKYAISQSVIAAANDLSGKKKRLTVGAMLRIPTDGRYVANAAQQQDDNSESGDDNDPRAIATNDKGTDEQSSKTTKADPKADSKAELVQSDNDKDKDVAIHRPAPPPANSKKLTHEVLTGETLYSIAARYNVRLADVRNWNNIPYNSDKVSLGDQIAVYVDKNFHENTLSVATSTKTTRNGFERHTVARGETLAKIADDYGVSMQEIRTASRMSKNGKIYVGQTLSVPVSAEKQQAQATRSATQDAPQTEPKSAVASTTAPAGKASVYLVKKDETLAGIAMRYNVNPQDVAAWNGIQGARIKPGMELKIYTQSVAKGSAGSDDSSAEKTYAVRQGDTLFSIARKYGLTVAALKQLNTGLTEKSLKAGQTVRLQ
jgi:membrane-bound lytic murein transglycosylase D